ncbi:replication initiation protein [Campylobacter concisus]|uniref:replication initiation protein n=1 Tax=Campylobacter concisus TaxID=199 RepID=UPI00122C41F1|nr:replication initiation protein [Campylobacter concisus]MCA6131404.1 replication initiation protein [Campylobacter concisus]MCA6133161.1 replication initiation protein [Campylobacter concisus]
MKNRNIVVHSDKITKGRSKLSLSEMKAFLATITTIDAKNDAEFKEVTLTKKEFCGDTNLDFRTVKLVCKTLLKQVYEIENNQVWKAYPIYQMFEYDKKTDEVRFKFNDYMRPYLLELTQKFTKYQIKNIINMTSKYSIRTYQLLKDFRDIKRHIEFELEDFCDKLEVPKSKRLWALLNRDILQTAIKEINELTDIRILGIFPERKRGKKVLSFSIKFCYEYEYEDMKRIEHIGLIADERLAQLIRHYQNKPVLILGSIYEIQLVRFELSKVEVIFLDRYNKITQFWFDTIEELDKAIQSANDFLNKNENQDSLF